MDDRQWASLCNVIGRSDLIEDVRFTTLQNRKKNEEELDTIVGEWTVQLTPEEVMNKMQSAGVPAGVVENAADISEDTHLKQRGIFWPIEHPDMGTFNHLGQSMIVSKTPAQAKMPSPRLGEHTEYVCTKIFGMSDEEFVDLLTAGVFE
jgi:crotonobetainyl-CoA:carnitine CoA-transferase CaiB-like acyl-CoA transferase